MPLARPAGALRLLAERRSRIRSACCPTTRAARGWPPRTCSPPAAAASPTSPAPSTSRPCACAATATAPPSPSAGLEPADGHVLTGPLVGGLGPRGGRRSCSPSPATAPDGIFAGNDQIARGVLDALRDRGIAVPGRGRRRRLRQLGGDGRGGAAAAHQRRHEPLRLGREAGRQIVRLIDGEAPAGVLRLPCTLVVRESCGAAADPERKTGAPDAQLRTRSTSPSVTLSGDFWRERLETVLTRTIPSQYPSSNPRACSSRSSSSTRRRRSRIPRRRSRLHHPDLLGQRHRQVDRGGELRAAPPPRRRRSRRRSTTSSAKLEKAQLPDGYLNLWYIGREIDNRWTNLRDNHELYNCGHLLEGAIAYFQATGRRRMLDVMERYLDHIRATFGTGPGQKRGYPGHQEIEIALVKLYHLTGEQEAARPRRLLHRRARPAAALLRHRARRPRRGARRVRPGHLRIQPVAQAGARAGQGRRPRRPRDVHVHRHGRPRRRARRRGAEARLRGALAGRDLDADVRHRRLRPLGLERGLHLRLRPAERHRLCRDLRLGRLDLLGAADAEPRPRRPATPTCWSSRSTTARSPGCRATASTTSTRTSSRATARHRRWDWHPCPCCTMNVSRLVASVGGYFYSTGTGVDRHAPLRRQRRRARGRRPRRSAIEETSSYPWSGRIRIAVHPDAPHGLRPEAAHPRLGARRDRRRQRRAVDVDAATTAAISTSPANGRAGDVVELDLPMPPERIFANPKVRMDLGRVALRRGPLVYCLEQADNPDAPVTQLALPRDRGDRGRRAPRPLRRHRGADRPRQGGERRRLGRHALPDRAAARSTGDADRDPLLPLGQPRARADDGLGPRELSGRPSACPMSSSSA